MVEDADEENLGYNLHEFKANKKELEELKEKLRILEDQHGYLIDINNKTPKSQY